MRKQPKPGTAFSEAEKADVTTACERLIEDFLKPRFLPAIRPTTFNYPVDILGKWHGTRAFRKTSTRSSTPPSPASTGSAETGSTFSGTAIRESGSVCIGTLNSPRLSRRSNPMDYSIPH